MFFRFAFLFTLFFLSLDAFGFPAAEPLRPHWRAPFSLPCDQPLSHLFYQKIHSKIAFSPSLGLSSLPLLEAAITLPFFFSPCFF